MRKKEDKWKGKTNGREGRYHYDLQREKKEEEEEDEEEENTREWEGKKKRI